MQLRPSARRAVLLGALLAASASAQDKCVLPEPHGIPLKWQGKGVVAGARDVVFGMDHIRDNGVRRCVSAVVEGASADVMHFVLVGLPVANGDAAVPSACITAQQLGTGGVRFFWSGAGYDEPTTNGLAVKPLLNARSAVCPAGANLVKNEAASGTNINTVYSLDTSVWQPAPHDDHAGAGVVIGFILVCMVCVGAVGAILAVLKHLGYLGKWDTQIEHLEASSAAAPKAAAGGANKVGPAP